MATEQGKDWRIRVKTGASTFVTMGGETSLSWKRANAKTDQSTKDDGKYASSSYGATEISFTVQGNLKLPDPGLAAIDAASKASPPEVEVQVFRAGDNDDAPRYQGIVAVGNFDGNFPKDGPATYSFDMANAAVPTIDNLVGA